jgi:hypothetical protein
MSILDEKSKAPELDWMAFENKTRKMVYDLLHPTILRVNAGNAQIASLNQECNSLKNKLYDFENQIFEGN